MVQIVWLRLVALHTVRERKCRSTVDLGSSPSETIEIRHQTCSDITLDELCFKHALPLVLSYVNNIRKEKFFLYKLILQC